RGAVVPPAGVRRLPAVVGGGVAHTATGIRTPVRRGRTTAAAIPALLGVAESGVLERGARPRPAPRPAAGAGDRRAVGAGLARLAGRPTPLAVASLLQHPSPPPPPRSGEGEQEKVFFPSPLRGGGGGRGDSPGRPGRAARRLAGRQTGVDGG